MQFPKKVTLFLVICLMLIGCWKKQSHEILPPDIPYYKLHGIVTDVDSNQPVTGVELVVNDVYLIYGNDWQSVTVYSDSSGEFGLETIFPGSYVADVYRDGYPVLSSQFMVLHEDRELALEICQPVLADGFLDLDSAINDFEPNLFVWNGSNLWTTGLYFGQIGDQTYDTGVDVLISMNLGTDGVLRTTHTYLDTSDGALGLTQVNDSIYAYFSHHINVISPHTGELLSTIELNDPIKGLTYSDSTFYSTWGKSIQIRGNDVIQIQNSFPTETGSLTAVGFRNNYLWAFDFDRGYLVKLDMSGQVMKTYLAFSDYQGIAQKVTALNFDDTGKLWVKFAAYTGGSDKLFWFNLSQ